MLVWKIEKVSNFVALQTLEFWTYICFLFLSAIFFTFAFIYLINMEERRIWVRNARLSCTSLMTTKLRYHTCQLYYLLGLSFCLVAHDFCLEQRYREVQLIKSAYCVCLLNSERKNSSMEFPVFENSNKGT